MLHTQCHRGCHDRGKQSLSCFIFSSNIIWFNHDLTMKYYDFPQRSGSKVAATFTYLITFNFSNMFCWAYIYYWSLDISIQKSTFSLYFSVCVIRISATQHSESIWTPIFWFYSSSQSGWWHEARASPQQNNNFLIFSPKFRLFLQRLQTNVIWLLGSD